MANQEPSAAVRGLAVLCVSGFAVAVVCEYVGPTQGWLERLTGQTTPPVTPPTEVAASKAQTPPRPPPQAVAPPSETSPAPVTPPTPEKRPVDPPAKPEVATHDEAEPTKTELELEYERLVAGYLKKLPAPEIGKKYKIKLRNRQTAEGKLIDISPGKITIQLRYGELTYALHQVHPKSIAKLFPERAAHFMAMRDIRKRRQEEAKATQEQEEAEQAVVSLPAQPKTADRQVVTPPLPAQPRRPLPTRTGAPKYDTTPAKTPEHLKETIQAFGQWLKFQHQRVGGKIADKIHVKQQGGNVVLYLNANELFLQQDYGTRFQLTEGLYKFWAFRCEAHRVVRELRDAHVVLMDGNGRIIGGSTPRNSADIWVEKNKK